MKNYQITSMEENFQKLKELKKQLSIFDISFDDFYSVKFTTSEVSLQGKYTPELREKLKKLGWCCVKVKGQKWYEKNKNGIEYTLTY